MAERSGLSRSTIGRIWRRLDLSWFPLITEKLMRRGVHPTVADLGDDIHAWIKNWNDNPQQFAWTKTTDEILNSSHTICRGSQS